MKLKHACPFLTLVMAAPSPFSDSVGFDKRNPAPKTTTCTAGAAATASAYGTGANDKSAPVGYGNTPPKATTTTCTAGATKTSSPEDAKIAALIKDTNPTYSQLSRAIARSYLLNEKNNNRAAWLTEVDKVVAAIKKNAKARTPPKAGY